MCCTGPDGKVPLHKIAFHWSLLFEVVDQLGEGRNWWELWVGYLTKYDRLPTHPRSQLDALAMVYKHFQQASMDFVQLMDIDFSAQLRCQCDDPLQHLVADGITVSCQLSNLCMAAPFAALSSDTHHQWGSQFRDRIYVANTKSRKLLRRFSGLQTSPEHGLPQDEFAVLVDKLRRQGQGDLACVVEAASLAGDSVTCQGWAQLFLQCLGSDAPACVLIRPGLAHLVRYFIEHRKWPSGTDHQRASLQLPGVWELCLQARASGDCASPEQASLLDHVVNLLRDLLRVRLVLFLPTLGTMYAFV